ncbi:MAG: ABC transporter ATP-binding protein [Thermoplasmata archaeon]
MDEHVIEVKDLYVSYDKKRFAVNGISFNVNKGEVFGFLGPNGAGKTTTIRTLTSVIKPKSGSVKILSMDIMKHSITIKSKIGVILQSSSLELSLNVEQNLYLYGYMWNRSRKEITEKVNELIEKFELDEFRKVQVSELSIGNRRKLQIARELIHDFEILFVDEPTTGLDPVIRKKVLDYFLELKRKGKTIFFTTHQLEDADYLCDTVSIINKGKIVINEKKDLLKTRYKNRRKVEILFNKYNERLFDYLKGIDFIESIKSPENENSFYELIINDPSKFMDLINSLLREGNELLWLNIQEASLEDIYMDIFGDRYDKDNKNVLQDN